MPENSNSLTKITELEDLLSINQAIVDGILIDLSLVFSGHSQTMDNHKLTGWKVLVTKTVFDRYIADPEIFGFERKYPKEKRYTELIFYIYCKFKQSKVLASSENMINFEMPVVVSPYKEACSEAIEKVEPGELERDCTLKVLIKRQTAHLIITLSGEN